MPVHRQLLDVLSRWDDCSAVEYPSLLARKRPRAEMIRSSPQFRDALEKTIETEIIPRLLLAHRLSTLARPDEHDIGDQEVAEFTRLVLDHELAVVGAYVDILLGRGIGAESIILNLLIPAARRLGEMWESDERDFVDVTIALTRIQHTLRSLGPAFREEGQSPSLSKQALLLAVPGEQHVLGMMIVGEYFRRAGWRTVSLSDPKPVEIEQLVSTRAFDLVGISASSDVLLPSASSAIDMIRKSSKNQSVLVMAGGCLFQQNPELARRIGADGTAEDGTQALAFATASCNQRLDAGGGT